MMVHLQNTSTKERTTLVLSERSSYFKGQNNICYSIKRLKCKVALFKLGIVLFSICFCCKTSTSVFHRLSFNQAKSADFSQYSLTKIPLPNGFSSDLGNGLTYVSQTEQWWQRSGFSTWQWSQNLIAGEKMRGGWINDTWAEPSLQPRNDPQWSALMKDTLWPLVLNEDAYCQVCLHTDCIQFDRIWLICLLLRF